MRLHFRLGHNFRHDRRGNVAAIFGLMAVPVMFLAGSGYDYSRASRLRIELQGAVDGTVLTLCQMPDSTTNAAIESKAQQLIDSYMPGGAKLVTPVTVTAKPRQIEVTATAVSPTAFAKLMGFQKLDVAATARCAPPYPKTFEIALVLDTTGSMETSDGTSSKLASAKRAAKDFIDYVGSDDAFDEESKIAIVPFSAAVAVDPAEFGPSTSWIDSLAQSDYHWANIDVPRADETTRKAFASRFDIFNHLRTVRSNWGWAGCFETLPYPANTRVEAPALADRNSHFVPLLAPDEPGSATLGYGTYKNQSFANSYLAESTNQSNCRSDSSLSLKDTEKRACKYLNPSNHVSGNSSITGTRNGPNYGCFSKPLKRLTKDFSSLKTYIDTLNAEGSTNIFEGFMWGWRAVSPKSVLVGGSDENKDDVVKVIILMSDGANTWNDMNNFNESRHSSFGYIRNANDTTVASRLRTGTALPSTMARARAAMDVLTLEGCSNAKTAGYSIYTVGFSVPAEPIDSEGLALLKSCASDDSQSFVVKSGTELVNAFKEIAKKIGKLRLTQ